MAMHHYTQGTNSLGSKMSALIELVNPSEHVIQAKLKDGGIASISTVGVSNTFIWPQEGEYWFIRKDNGQWRLDSKIDVKNDYSIDQMQPGEARIASDTIKDASGKSVLATFDSDADSYSILQHQGANQIESAVVDSKIITFTTKETNNLVAGQQVTLSGFKPETYNGKYTVLGLGPTAKLAEAITTTGTTSITLDSVEGWPSSGTITIDKEIMSFSAVLPYPDNKLTINARGLNNTAAATHQVDATVKCSDISALKPTSTTFKIASENIADIETPGQIDNQWVPSNDIKVASVNLPPAGSIKFDEFGYIQFTDGTNQYIKINGPDSTSKNSIFMRGAYATIQLDDAASSQILKLTSDGNIRSVNGTIVTATSLVGNERVTLDSSGNITASNDISASGNIGATGYVRSSNDIYVGAPGVADKDKKIYMTSNGNLHADGAIDLGNYDPTTNPLNWRIKLNGTGADISPVPAAGMVLKQTGDAAARIVMDGAAGAMRIVGDFTITNFANDDVRIRLGQSDANFDPVINALGGVDAVGANIRASNFYIGNGTSNPLATQAYVNNNIADSANNGTTGSGSGLGNTSWKKIDFKGESGTMRWYHTVIEFGEFSITANNNFLSDAFNPPDDYDPVSGSANYGANWFNTSGDYILIPGIAKSAGNLKYWLWNPAGSTYTGSGNIMIWIMVVIPAAGT